MKVLADAPPPHIVTLHRGQDVLPMGEMRDIAAIEVATGDPATDATVAPVTLAAVLPHVYALMHMTEAGHQSEWEMPRYFCRYPSGLGLGLHPTCDRAYWLRVTYRAPVRREQRDAATGNAAE